MLLLFALYSYLLLWLLSIVLFLLGIIRIVQFLLAEKGSGRRKDLRVSFLRFLISALVLAACLLLLGEVMSRLIVFNM